MMRMRTNSYTFFYVFSHHKLRILLQKNNFGFIKKCYSC